MEISRGNRPIHVSLAVSWPVCPATLTRAQPYCRILSWLALLLRDDTRLVGRPFRQPDRSVGSGTICHRSAEPVVHGGGPGINVLGSGPVRGRRGERHATTWSGGDWAEGWFGPRARNRRRRSRVGMSTGQVQRSILRNGSGRDHGCCTFGCLGVLLAH